MRNEPSFKDYAVVSCGVMTFELNHLVETGFLDAKKVFYTVPGLHQIPDELERQVRKHLQAAKKIARKIIIVYGGTYCYINVKDPYKTIDTIIDDLKEDGYFISRTQMDNCIDMLASVKERDEIAAGEKIWFCTPGWVRYRDLVFKGWDKANANENFPQYSGGAIVLDAVGFFDKCLEEHPERILDFSDWMAIPLDGRGVSSERVKKILIDAMHEEDRPAK